MNVELEEVDHKRYQLEDDLEAGERVKRIDFAAEIDGSDDRESTQTTDTGRKRDWPSNRLESTQQGWMESKDEVYVEERRGVTFSPDTTGGENGTGGVFVSYLGTPNVRVLHSTTPEAI